MTSLLLHKAGAYSCIYHALTGYGFNIDASSYQPAEYYRQELDRLYDEIYHKSLSSTDTDDRCLLLHILYAELVDLGDADRCRQIDQLSKLQLHSVQSTYPCLRLMLDATLYSQSLSHHQRHEYISHLSSAITQMLHDIRTLPLADRLPMASLAVEFLSEYAETKDTASAQQLSTSINNLIRNASSYCSEHIKTISPSFLYHLFTTLYIGDSDSVSLLQEISSEARRRLSLYSDDTLEWWQCRHIVAISLGIA